VTLQRLPPTRRRILEELKKRGDARAEELADAVAVTPSAMRQHLSGLLGDGLVAFEERRGGPGRPKHVYHLTDEADVLFPKFYPELTNELLDYVADDAPELVDRIFDRRRQRRVADARHRMAGLDLPGRVAELTRILDEDGYLAEWTAMDDGSYRIVEHNCAILHVAARYGLACTSELDFIRAVLPGATVERVTHIVSGARHCAYAVTPRAARARVRSGA
jgi:DeoR family suf operon transcriptional repressor